MKILRTLAAIVLLAAAASAADVDATVERLLAGLTLDGDAERAALVEELFSERLLAKHGTEKLANFLATMRSDLRRPSEPPTIRDERRQPLERNLVIESGDKALRVVVEIEEATGRIDGLLSDTEVSSAPPKAVTAEQLPAAIAEHLAERVAADEFSGAVLVARGGKPIYAEAFGLADRAKGRPVTLDTPINVGSMTKMITGLAVMQLVRAGKIDLDAPLGRYLPELPNETLRERATIRQLLTHRAGVGSYWNAAFQARAGEIDDLDALIETFIDEPLLFEPGAGHEYSNGGPVLLGKVIEAVTGQSYYDYVEKKIYRPAGMRHSGHFKKSDDTAGFARGYHRSSPDAPREDTQAMRPLMGSPAGSSYHSANDLLRFIKALTAGKLIDAEGREMLWEPRVREYEQSQYGFLWGNQFVDGVRSVGHNGGGPGVSADFRHFPELDTTVIVLSNYGRAAGPVSSWIAGTISAM